MIFKIIQVFLLATLKYLLTVPYAILIGIEYKYALPAILIGGMMGFIFFYYFSRKVVFQIKRILPYSCNLLPEFWKARCRRVLTEWHTKRKNPVFTRRNRMLVRLKNNYGLWGIVITTPVLLSIPVGAFLASHYYPRNRKIVIYILISIVIWGTLLSLVWLLFPEMHG